ncbi:hypothetical protein SH501x_003907 [Pirellulaceae bacterium SH501]
MTIRFTKFQCLWIGLCLVLGCQSSNGYPEVSITATTNTHSACHQCGKRMETVEDKNRLRIGAGEYIVCSDACREKQSSWHRSQFGTAGTR